MPIDALGAATSFDPEVTSILAAAFDTAWTRVERSGSPLAEPENAAATRAVLARHIIAAAQAGERDQNRLVDLAMSELTLHHPSAPSSNGRAPPS
jgi:hypothetical protein